MLPARFRYPTRVDSGDQSTFKYALGKAKNDGPGRQFLTQYDEIYTSHRPHDLGSMGVDVKKHCKGSSATRAANMIQMSNAPLED